MESGDTSDLVPGLESLVLVVMNVIVSRDLGLLTFTLKAVPATAKMVVMLQAHFFPLIS